MANPVHDPKKYETRPCGGKRGRRPEPNPLGGNFILMPSLLDYLSPDLTLPEQYFLSQENDDGMGAEKALMYAVLKDGIRSFYKHIGSTRRKYRKLSDEAEQWLLDDTWDDPFSFQVICDTLGIDPAGLRGRLLDWKRSEMARRELTGDTSSAQVGRSPFPNLVHDSDEAVDNPEDDEACFDDDGDESWNEGEHLSLEELRYEEFEKVA